MSTISVSKSVKLGLPQYSSVSFSASLELDISDTSSSPMYMEAFRTAWKAVDYQLRDKLYPYKDHGLVKNGTISVDPEWIDENEKK